jgi:hypothetical protein
LYLSDNFKRSAKDRSGFLVLAILIGSLVWLVHPSASSSRKLPLEKYQGGQSASHQCKTCPPPSQRRIYAPIVELQEAENCEIVLNSRSPHPIEVTPTFYTAKGDAIVGEPVQLQPAEIRFIKVEQLIPASYHGRHRWGGMTLSYMGGVLEVWAQLTFHGVGGGGSIDETFNILEEPGSDTREAVWSMPKGSHAIIALGNSSERAIHTTAQFLDDSTEEIEIAPFATKLLRRHARGHEEEDTVNDSVKLTTIGPAGSLRVAGFITSDDHNFTSSIRFSDTKKATGPNLYATNLRLKNTTQRMVLKNTSDSVVTTSARFFSAAGDQSDPIVLPSLILEPQQTVSIDLGPLRTAAAARTDLNSVSVQVQNSGSPGSLIGALYSVEDATQLTYDVPLRDSGPMRNSTGSYPWRVDGHYTTIVTITNVSDQPASFIVDIRYPGGHYFLPSKEVAVGGTATFDMRELIDEQKPDKLGTVLPLSATGGQFHWSVFGGPITSKFIGRSEVVSLSQRVSSSYSCPVCCPVSGPFGDIVFSGQINVNVNGLKQVNTTGYITDCNGTQTDIGGLSMDTWWTNDPSMVSLDTTFGTSPVLKGLKVGETYINGKWFYNQFDSDGGEQCTRTYNESTVSCPVDVHPTVTSISPEIGLIGQVYTATIIGTGFAAGSNVSIDSGTINSETINSSTSITVNFRSNDDASPGNHVVRVTSNGVTSTNNVNFYVQIPTSISVLSVDTLSSGSTGDFGCNPAVTGDYGIEVAIHYQVRDQVGDPILSDEMVAQEQTGTTWDDIGGPPDRFATSANFPSLRFTDSNGRFYDVPFGACGIGPFTHTDTQPIRIVPLNQNLYLVRTNHFTITSSASGSGTISNGSDIFRAR